MRLGKTRFIGLLIAVAVAAIGTFALWRPRPPDLTVPAILQGKEPSVVALVEETLKAVAANPGDPELWMRLGYVYEANFHTALALESYQHALSLDASRPKAWYRVARVKMGMGDRVGAIEAAQHVVELAPNFAPVRRRLGFWQLERGHLEQAQTSFERAIALDAEDPASWWGLARAFLQKQQPQKAAEVLEEVVEKWPDDAYAHLLLGTAYRQLGRWQEARVELERGAGSAPVWQRDAWDHEMVQYKTGLQVERDRAGRLFKLGQVDAAIVLLERLRRHYPDNMAVLNNLGVAYIKQKRPRRALQVLRTALQRYPEDASLHFNAASIYIDLKNPTQALEHLDRAIALDPGLSTTYKKKGILLGRMGQYRAAIETFEQGLQYDPHNPSILLQLGLVQCSMQQWDVGLASLQKAAELDSTFYQAFMAIGEAKKRLGALDEAEAAFKRAAALNPKLKGLLQEVQ